MKAKYLLRLDDANPFADKRKWQRLERLLDKYNVRPIVGVIPENFDETLKVSKADPDFWQTVSRWQKKKWEVALHGYQHTFHDIERSLAIFPFHARSEFTGLNLQNQSKKIREAIKIFRSHNIEPKIWVAPAHNFDVTTITALAGETNIKVISDGLTVNPYFWKGFHFVPQQLWWFRPRHFGVWTVCLHPDNLSSDDFVKLENIFLNRYYKDRIIEFDELILTDRGKGLADRFFEVSFWLRFRTTLLVKKLLKKP